MVANLNISEVPNTPENMMIGIGVIFGIGLFCLIGWGLYQALGK